uniref:Uncharacterized protein n=1 Tax=Tetranychus urticae TaxID=32264 RepID=T1L3P2_TETUR
MAITNNVTLIALDLEETKFQRKRPESYNTAIL